MTTTELEECVSDGYTGDSDCEKLPCRRSFETYGYVGNSPLNEVDPTGLQGSPGAGPKKAPPPPLPPEVQLANSITGGRTSLEASARVVVGAENALKNVFTKLMELYQMVPADIRKQAESQKAGAVVLDKDFLTPQMKQKYAEVQAAYNSYITYAAAAQIAMGGTLATQTELFTHNQYDWSQRATALPGSLAGFRTSKDQLRRMLSADINMAEGADAAAKRANAIFITAKVTGIVCDVASTALGVTALAKTAVKITVEQGIAKAVVFSAASLYIAYSVGKAADAARQAGFSEVQIRSAYLVLAMIALRFDPDFGPPRIAPMVSPDPITNNPNDGPFIELFHKGQLQDGTVSGSRALSTGTNIETVQQLGRDGSIFTFRVPMAKLLEWESQNLAQRFSDLDQSTGTFNEEWRIYPPASEEMNQYKVTTQN